VSSGDLYCYYRSQLLMTTEQHKTVVQDKSSRLQQQAKVLTGLTVSLSLCQDAK